MTSWLSSWRRLITTTTVCFVLFLALLAWRVSAGQDPVLSANTQQSVPSTSSSASDSSDSSSSSSESSDSSSSEDTQTSTPTTQAS